MNSKTTTKLFFFAAMMFASAVSWAQEKPNIVVIYTDDQGFGDASCLNPDAKFSTPNLDRLATEGLTFTNGHSSDSVCTPSRYGLLTGRYSWRTTLKRSVMGAEAKCLIADDQSTLGTMLQTQGYRTVMVGKWHLGMDFPGTSHKNRDWTKPVLDMPLDKGFDEFFGIPASLNYGVLAWFDGRHAAVPPTLFTAKRPNRRHIDYRIKPPYQDTFEEAREVRKKNQVLEVAPDFVDNQCLTRFTDRTIEWIKTHKASEKSEQPFFVYLPLTSPHYPVCPLPEFHNQGDCGGYGEFMIETDYHVGRVIKCLEDAGIDDNTLIVFSSDNGPEKSWQKRINDFDHRSNFIYRDGKRSVYEGGHRVPFFVRWPGGIKSPGRKFDGLVGQIDLFATIAEITGFEMADSDGVDSQSFADVLTNAESEFKRLPLINHSIGGRYSITEGDWKLIMPHKDNKRELYNLGDDAGEKNNLLAANPKIAKRLESQITNIVVGGRTTPGAAQANDTGHWEDLTWLTPKRYKANAKVK